MVSHDPSELLETLNYETPENCGRIISEPSSTAYLNIGSVFHVGRDFGRDWKSEMEREEDKYR